MLLRRTEADGSGRRHDRSPKTYIGNIKYSQKALYFSLYDKDRTVITCCVWFSRFHGTFPPDQVPRTRRLQRHVHGWLFGLQRSSLPVINCAPRLRVT
jgi:hypothetical protein